MVDTATETFIKMLPNSLRREKKKFVALLGVVAKEYPPDVVLSRQGEKESRIFIFNSGWACNFREFNDGNRHIIDTPLKGDIWGIRASGGANPSSLASITTLSVFEIPVQTFRQALGTRPELVRPFIRLIARQCAIATEHLTNIARRNARERTAHYLLELAERLAATGENTEHGYRCPLTQDTLADALGLTKIHVNRTLRQLREDQLLSFRWGSVEFINRRRLEEMSGFDAQYLRLD
jgi:CRP-like cAMP-binding protein